MAIQFLARRPRESLNPKRGYTAEDFKAVTIAATSPEMISAPPSGAKTLKEFIDNARSSTAQFGTAGAGSASYIVTQYFFERIVKIPTTHVPFQGGAPAVTAAMSNQIPLVATPPAAGAAAPVKAGALRGLAIASEKRMAILPDVPTYGERLRRIGMDRIFPARSGLASRAARL
jgi:tripartite-type tricarboxylate transporter receptor subunit TctC